MHQKFLTIFFLIGILAANCLPLHAESFTVGPGDVLEISVWRDENLSREIVVLPDNSISFPLIGDVNVAGLSVTQIRDVIKQKLTDYVPDASVTVVLKQINSLKAYVIGQVKNPGEFPITLETRMMQILSMAKGLTPFAAERDIHILRYEGTQVKKIGFDYKEILKGNNLEQDIVLQRGDVVVVP